MQVISKATRAHAHFVSRMIHDKLHLTFAQCVQVIMTNHIAHAHEIANRNIRKRNEVLINENIRLGNDPAQGTLSEFSAATFSDLFMEQVDFALSCKNKVW